MAAAGTKEEEENNALQGRISKARCIALTLKWVKRVGEGGFGCLYVRR